MLKSVIVMGILALSSAAFADELAHDAAACPDLTGKYLIKVEGQADMTEILVSAKDAAGNPTISEDVGDGNGPAVIAIDGVKKDNGDGTDSVFLCNAQTVVLYVHQEGKLLQTLTYGLDADKNLAIVSTIEGQAAVTYKGERQAQ